MRTIGRYVSDNRQPATGYRARINNFAKKPQFGESCLVDKIDNELELVQTFEIGKLGRIAGANKGVEARTNQRARAATKHCLLAKKIGLGLLAKSRFEYTGTRAANSFRPRQGRLLRVSAAILMNCN